MPEKILKPNPNFSKIRKTSPFVETKATICSVQLLHTVKITN
jgi:hypothetical protein